MTTITVEHISKYFYESVDGVNTERITGVEDVSFKIDEGHVLAIIGPSGCGKSTLLRIIAGLIHPDNGKVFYDNVPIAEVDRRDRGIGMVFQDGALMPHWKAGQSVGFFLSLRNRVQEVPERIHRISAITGIGLDVLMGRRPSQLSGGEKQRISIARALTRDLELLLMDEPFANIDALLRSQARVELKRLMDEFPVTAVYVTHDQIEAVSLARRVAVMNEGRLEQLGTYHQLYANPKNLFVAQFVGTEQINLFHGFVIENTWKGDSFGGFPIRRDLEEGTRVIMGIRPEHVRIATEDDTDIIEAQVEHVTPYFAERYKQVEVWGNGERWKMHTPIDYAIEPKDIVRCTINRANMFYFDPESGVRIG